jgi:hypothetical protein
VAQDVHDDRRDVVAPHGAHNNEALLVPGHFIYVFRTREYPQSQLLSFEQFGVVPVRLGADNNRIVGLVDAFGLPTTCLRGQL